MKIKCLLLTAILFAACSFGFAQSKAKTIVAATTTPDAVVKALYRAHDGGASPFFQTKSRALMNKYFTKKLADLIWKDLINTPKGEVGNLDFDPLYDAQDTQISRFKIGKPAYGEGNLQVADVEVTFKNMNHNARILFRLEQNSSKQWKIAEIYYPDHEDEANNSLSKILTLS